MRNRSGNLADFAPLTVALLSINIAIYILTAIRSESLVNIDGKVLHDLYDSNREGLWENEWIRLVAPNFLHGGLMHIFFNMSALHYLGPRAEMHFGSSNFGSIYLVSGICGFCFSQLFGGYHAIGASAAIFGIMGAEIAVTVLACPVLKNAWRNPQVRKLLFETAIYFVLGLAATFGEVDNWAHLGGLVFGIILAGLFETWRKLHRLNPGLVAVVVLLVAGLICVTRWPVYNPYYHVHMAAVAIEGDGGSLRQEAEAEFAEAKKWAQYWRMEPIVNQVIEGYQRDWTLNDAREYGYKFIQMRYEQLSREQIASVRENKHRES